MFLVLLTPPSPRFGVVNVNALLPLAVLLVVLLAAAVGVVAVAAATAVAMVVALLGVAVPLLEALLRSRERKVDA